jgi:hypothetical protein
MKKLQIAIMAAALVIGAQARAGWYDVTFTGDGTDAHGVIFVDSNGDATGGVLDVTAGTATGNWTLQPGSGDDGIFIFDNKVTAGSDPFLTSGGLLFTGTQFGHSAELNLWGNGPENYSLYANNGGQGGYNPAASGVATLTPVPEPTTMVAGALLLLPFGMSTLRMWRKSRVA